MSLYIVLILFFRIPAAVRLISSPGVTPLYNNNYTRLWVYGRKHLRKYIPVLLCLLPLFNTAIAQVDSNYVDTISMKDIEAPVADTELADEASIGYYDQEGNYIDTTIKHIYDSSQFFFNWKSYYNDPFRDKKISPRRLADAEANALKKEDDFWYIPAIEKLEQRIESDPKFRDSLLKIQEHELTDANRTSFLYQPWFNMLLWIILIGIFAAAVIYFLIQNKISIFSKEAISAATDTTEEGHEDIFSLSYTKLIQQAEKDTDFRRAIRLLFLQILKSLNDTGTIQYQPDYTNLQYLQQLTQSRYYNEFFGVMRSYEYVWYGKFIISQEQYKAIKNDFLKLQNKIR